MKLIKIFLLVIVFLPNCQIKEEINIDFCDMWNRDQSHVNHDMKNMEKYNSDKNIRHDIIKENYLKLISYTRVKGFPEINPFGTVPIDTCKFWAVTLTLTHIAQIDSEAFYNARITKLFKDQIDMGLLKKEVLIPAVKMSSHEVFCISQKKDVYHSLITWGIDTSYFKDVSFVQCN